MGAAPTAPRNRVTTALDARGISISALARASGPGASARRRAATPSRPRATMPSSSSHPSASPDSASKNADSSAEPEAWSRSMTSGQFGQRDTGLARGITSSSENARSHAFSRRPTQLSPDAAMLAGERMEPRRGASCSRREGGESPLLDVSLGTPERTLTTVPDGCRQLAAAIAATATRDAVHHRDRAICRLSPLRLGCAFSSSKSVPVCVKKKRSQ